VIPTICCHGATIDNLVRLLPCKRENGAIRREKRLREFLGWVPSVDDGYDGDDAGEMAECGREAVDDVIF
jgi:hypothetical protein